MGLHVYEENSASLAEMSEITLNCIVKNNPRPVIQVSIDRNKSVYMLKKAIKKELQDTFKNIDPIGIKVWFVQITQDAQDESWLDRLKDESVERVFEGMAVDEVQRVVNSVESYLSRFKNTDDGTIYVVVYGQKKWCASCSVTYSTIEGLKKHKKLHKLIKDKEEGKLEDKIDHAYEFEPIYLSDEYDDLDNGDEDEEDEELSNEMNL